MSSSSKLTFEPNFCLTNSPQSSTRKSPFEQHQLFKAVTLKSPKLLPFLGHPDTLVTGRVKLGSFYKHWVGGGWLFKVAVTSHSTSFPEALLYSDLPSYPPSYSTLDLLSAFEFPCSFSTHDVWSRTPRPSQSPAGPSTCLLLKFICTEDNRL